MATLYGPVAGRSYSKIAKLTGTAADTLTSAGLLGPSDQTTIRIANSTNGATATTFTIGELELDGNTRTITTVFGNGLSSVAVPTAVPTTNGQELLIVLNGPLDIVTVTLGGASPTGNIYLEIQETTWRPH